MLKKCCREVLVVDTCVVITLANLGILHFLNNLANKCNTCIIAPQGVVEELQRGKSCIDLHTLPVSIQAPSTQSQALISRVDIPRSLGRGEREVIALTFELVKQNCNAFVVTDDKKARSAANKLNLQFTGSIGIIERLKKCRVIDKNNAINLIARLLQTSHRMDSKTISFAINKIQSQ